MCVPRLTPEESVRVQSLDAYRVAEYDGKEEEYKKKQHSDIKWEFFVHTWTIHHLIDLVKYM